MIAPEPLRASQQVTPPLTASRRGGEGAGKKRTRFHRCGENSHLTTRNGGRGGPSAPPPLPRGTRGRALRPQALRASLCYLQPGRPPRRRHSFLLHFARGAGLPGQGEPQGAAGALSPSFGASSSAGSGGLSCCARRPSYRDPSEERPRYPETQEMETQWHIGTGAKHGDRYRTVQTLKRQT